MDVKKATTSLCGGLGAEPPLGDRNCKSNFLANKNKPFLHLVIIGNTNHGKTTLVAAITKVATEHYQLRKAISYAQINNPQKERCWGYDVYISYAEYETPNRQYLLMDFPSNIDFIKYTASHSALWDGAVLVISASQGVEKQTREQIQLISQLVPKIVVFVNEYVQFDKFDDVMEQILKEEINELLGEYGYSDSPIIFGSALQALENPKSEQGNKILQLLESIDTFIETPQHYLEKPFLMPIEFVYPVENDSNCVLACGRVNQGVLKVKAPVSLVGLGLNKEVIVKDIIMYGKSFDKAYSGDTPSLVLQNVTLADVKAGQVLAKPNTITAHSKFSAYVYWLSKEECELVRSYYSGYKLDFYFSVLDIAGTLILIDDYKTTSGEHMKIYAELVTPVIMSIGSRVTILNNKKRVGLGFVTEVLD